MADPGSREGKQYTFDMIPGGRARDGNPPPPVLPDEQQFRELAVLLAAAERKLTGLVNQPEPEDQIGKLRAAKLRAGLEVPLEQIQGVIKLLDPYLREFGPFRIDWDQIEEIPYEQDPPDGEEVS